MDLMSLADFYFLCAKVAVEISRFSSGTTLTIPFRWGRIDADECTADADICDVVTSEHRLPSSIKSLDHITEVFIERMVCVELSV